MQRCTALFVAAAFAALGGVSCGMPAGWECTSREPCPGGQTCAGNQDLPPEATDQLAVPTCFWLCNSSTDCVHAATGGVTGLRACIEGICVLFETSCSTSEQCPQDFYCARESNQCLRYPLGETLRCFDGVRSDDETDVDCGGGSCPPCRAGRSCVSDNDCETSVCDFEMCAVATCNDGTLNNGESAVDCGGDSCPACSDGLPCRVATDCASARCELSSAGRVCASCDDAIASGAETGVDCGGSVCAACADGLGCRTDVDCSSGDCAGGTCNSCGDGTPRGAEECDDGNILHEECAYSLQAASCMVCGPQCATVAGIPNYCGDGNLDTEAFEVCDDGPANSQLWSPLAHCNPSCSGPAPSCGDGQVTSPEESCGEPGLPACGVGQTCHQCSCVQCLPQGALSEAAAFTTAATSVAVAVSQTTAFVADGGLVRILDVADPTAPTELGVYSSPGSVSGLTLVGALLYVVIEGTGAGFRIVDVTDLHLPVELGAYSSPDYSYQVAVIDTVAYVASRGAGLRIVSIADPSSPTEISFYDTPGDAYGVAVLGATVYLAHGASGLKLIDVSTPASPTEVGIVDTPGFAYGVTVAGSYAYIADKGGGLRIVDVSNRSTPTEIGFMMTAGVCSGVGAFGGHVYLALEDAGLAVVDVGNPSAPTQAAWHDTSGLAVRVEVAGKLAYVADSAAGLRLIRLCP